MVKERQPREMESTFPEDVLPTVGFLSKLPGLEKEFETDDIKSWGGKALVGDSELTIGASFLSEMRRIDNRTGIRPFNGREIHISVSKHLGDDVEDLVEYWTLLEDPKNNQIIVALAPCHRMSMLLPDAKSHMFFAVDGKLVVAKGKLDTAEGLLTEGDIDKEKSQVNYCHFQKKISPVPLKEIFEAMGALKNAILSARPVED